MSWKMSGVVWERLRVEAEAAGRACPALVPALALSAMTATPAEGLAGLLGLTIRPVKLDAATA